MNLPKWIKIPLRPVFRMGAMVAGTFRRLFLEGGAVSGLGARVAGVTVNESTALTLPALMAVVRTLAQTVSMLPVSLYVREDRGRRKIARHPVSMLIKNPCPMMIPMAFWETMMSWALLCGYGRALIVRDPRTAAPVEMWPIEPWRIDLRFVGGVPYYFWRRDPDRDGHGGLVVLDASEVFDLHGLGGDGMTGFSLVSYGAKAIGTGLARQDYAASYFENGVWGSGAIKYPAGLSDKAYERLKRSFAEEWTGPQNAFRPLLFEEGGQWETLRIPNKDAQLIEAGQFTVLEICRLAGVPPHKVYALDRMTWSNIEHMQIEWRQDGVMPWTTRIAQEIQRKLIMGGFGSALYAWHNLDGLERGDIKSRMEAGQTSIFSGIRTLNEVRAMEELEAVGPEGDALYMQSAMVPVTRIFAPPPPPPPPPAPPPPPPPPDDEDDEDDAESATSAVVIAPADWRALAESVRPAFDAAARLVVRREMKTVEAKREKCGTDRVALIQWANRWYSGERGAVADTFGAPLSCLARLWSAAGHAESRGVDLGPALTSWQRRGIERATGEGVADEEALIEALSVSVFGEAVGGEQ